jgi:hypothetical protein
MNNDKYNYQHFNPKDYNFSIFEGPKAGEKYINFQAVTLKGKEVSLSDYLDKPIVLDTGSITCPMYANTTNDMNELQNLYPNVHFLLLYIREAHPGEKTKAIQSMENKVEHAKSTHTYYNETREILIDSIDGTAHKLYGSMPNMTYVIGINGIVKFRANWTNIDALKTVLKTIDSDVLEKKDFFVVTKPKPWIVIRTLLIGGFSAMKEFFIGLPQLMRQHKEVKSKSN